MVSRGDEQEGKEAPGLRMQAAGMWEDSSRKCGWVAGSQDASPGSEGSGGRVGLFLGTGGLKYLALFAVSFCPDQYLRGREWALVSVRGSGGGPQVGWG